MSDTKITFEQINSKIVKEEFHVLGDKRLTVCILTLQNGYTVTGESHCVDIKNFNKEIGEKIAKDNAVDKIWVLEGYLLKQKLFELQ